MEQIQATNVKDVVKASLVLLSPYAVPPVTGTGWIELMRALFAVVKPAADRSAELARDFYDEERARMFPDLPRHDVLLSTLTFDRFLRDMDEVRSALMLPGSSPAEVHSAALRAARSVENSARWTIMRAVETPDPALDEAISSRDIPTIRRGWARVATGAETCGWCLMLVSRGPAYSSAESAGVKRSALRHADGSGSFSKESMNAWHTGCDCKVVPVFNLDDWEGMDRWKAAEEMWKSVTKGKFGKDAINAMTKAAKEGQFKRFLADS